MPTAGPSRHGTLAPSTCREGLFCHPSHAEMLILTGISFARLASFARSSARRISSTGTGFITVPISDKKTLNGVRDINSYDDVLSPPYAARGVGPVQTETLR